jgi:hypothetical protein
MHSFLDPKIGFHPKIITTFPKHDLALPNCSFHLLYAFPPLVFVDVYELGNYADFFAFHHVGESNLELPIVAVPEGISSLLLDVKKCSAVEGGNCTVALPLHLRYGYVNDSGAAFQTADIPWPEAFYSCNASSGNSLYGFLTHNSPGHA